MPQPRRGRTTVSRRRTAAAAPEKSPSRPRSEPKAKRKVEVSVEMPTVSRYDPDGRFSGGLKSGGHFVLKNEDGGKIGVFAQCGDRVATIKAKVLKEAVELVTNPPKLQEVADAD